MKRTFFCIHFASDIPLVVLEWSRAFVSLCPTLYQHQRQDTSSCWFLDLMKWTSGKDTSKNSYQDWACKPNIYNMCPGQLRDHIATGEHLKISIKPQHLQVVFDILVGWYDPYKCSLSDIDTNDFLLPGCYADSRATVYYHMLMRELFIAQRPTIPSIMQWHFPDLITDKNL